ncbi:MAG: phosphate acyltransferase, partial [Gemmatimonadota bacterium]|nr:phosphate acyltransferase [Gemmatimonadota bacterium]
LENRLGRGRAIMRTLSNRASTHPQRIALTDANDPRILRAARALADEAIAQPILIGERTDVERAALDAGISLEGVPVFDPSTAAERPAYAQAFWSRRQRRGVTLAEAERRMLQAEYFGAGMVRAGDADAMVTGQNLNYPRALRPALEVAGPSPDVAVAGIYMMVSHTTTLFFADCTVNIDPDPVRLAEIAMATADFVRGLGIVPQVAMLSFSNFGSVRHPKQAKVAEAVRRLHEIRPALAVDGEMQADTAVVESILQGRYPFSRLQTAANVLIFPDLNAANICYKLLGRLGGAQAIGPILVGMAEPIHVLERDSGVEDIVNMAVIAAVDAQERARHRPRRPAAGQTS